MDDEEIGIDIPFNAKVTSLVKLVKESEDFDEEFVKYLLGIVQGERTNKAVKEVEKIERERIYIDAAKFRYQSRKSE